MSIEKETIAGLAEEMKNRKNNFIIGSWLRITRFLIWNFIVCVSVICSSYKLYEVAQLQDLNFEVNPIDVIIQSVKSTVRSLSDKSYFIQSLENGFEKIGSSLKFTHSDSLEPMGALIILASLSIAIPLQQWYKLARNLWGVIEVKECLSSTRSDLFIPLTNSQDIEDDEEFGWSIAGPNLYDGLKLKNLKVVDAFGDIVLKASI